MHRSIRRLFSLAWLALVLFASAAQAALDAPTVSAETSGGTVTVSWTAVDRAQRYIVYYAPSPENTPIVRVKAADGTSVSLSLSKGAYVVAVRAYSRRGRSPLSDAVQFEIGGT